MKKTSIKIVSFITAVALAAGFGNLFFFRRGIGEQK